MTPALASALRRRATAARRLADDLERLADEAESVDGDRRNLCVAAHRLPGPIVAKALGAARARVEEESVARTTLKVESPFTRLDLRRRGA